MDARDRWEAKLALAMLPIGGTMTAVSAIAGITVALRTIDVLIRPHPGAVWLLSWCIGAFVIAVRNVTCSIETMSAFDWRPLPGILGWSAVAAGTYPGWWLDG